MMKFDPCEASPAGNRAERRAHARSSSAALALIAAIVLGATGQGVAAAEGQGGLTPPSTAPDGGQGGLTPPSTGGGGQGGATPAPPAPLAQPDPGPQFIPGPPVDAAPRTQPDYSNTSPSYSPSYFQGPSTQTAPAYNGPSRLHLPTPTPNVRPIVVDKDIIRIGKFEYARPAWLTKEQRRTINNYSAYLEAKIAQGLVSVGFSPREADRQAAATTIGAVIGGTAGALAVGIPAAVVLGLGGALVGTGIGAAIGAVVPPAPINAGPGALIGAGAGAAVGLAAAAGLALGGAVAGGVIGGLAGYALGGGDPNAHPADPTAPAPGPRHAKPAPAPLPNPAGNQYELTADKTAGLPGNGSVSYVVNRGGDVSVNATIAGHDVHAGWTKAQADAPLQALGAAAPQARAALDRATKQVSDVAANVVRGLHVDFPQTHAPAAAAARK